ncbi:MAG: hypothetical protein WC563_12475 [Brevundimonas sp.]|uniref:hypothetical protein n=1 Tax=Brevundimonas sp. TaxID=1871086 RepID=UPI003564661A
MARPKPRRPKPGRGLPPPYKQTPEEEAEDDRIRAELLVEYERLDAIMIIKQAEADERARIKALKRQVEALAAEPVHQPDVQPPRPIVSVAASPSIRDLWL